MGEGEREREKKVVFQLLHPDTGIRTTAVFFKLLAQTDVGLGQVSLSNLSFPISINAMCQYLIYPLSALNNLS